ncbi:MAG TPA: NADH-quinone oxidoreductase subunit M [Halococcus sp.]|nr:NADH-quinone oxidoreductase subunit M [Halococcus sp.]
MLIELILVFCLLGAAVVFFLPDEYAPFGALVASFFPLVTSFVMWAGFDGAGNAFLGGELAYETKVQWISLGQYSVNWFVGVDGISMALVVLTTVLTTLAILTAWTPIDDRRAEFYGLLLFMEGGLLGVFCALDFFLWLVFWEAVLIPVYLLIGVWGGPDKRYAAIKFFVYTNIGTLVMFIGFAALVFGLGDSISSLSMPAIAQALRAGELEALGGIAPGTIKTLAFAALFFGFAIKMAIVPFHTWLPDAYTESATPVTVILAGVVTKMGTYAMLRFNFTMLRDVTQEYAQLIALFAVVTVIYGALLALSQRDLKRIVAYSSIPSMGFVLLGLVAYTQYGLSGAVFQMVSHGLLTGLLFACVGVIYNSTDTRMVGEIGGLADRMPITATAFVTGCFGYMGLPFMSGFMGEYFIFQGAFDSFAGSPLFTAIAMFGIVIIAGYYLFAMQRTLFGEFTLATDASVGRTAVHDIIPLIVLIAFVIALGVAPDIVFGMISDAVAPMLGGGV